MKTIIFGGSGFVGSHVAEALDDFGHEVTIFDLNKSPYLRPGQKFISGNILDQERVKKAVKGQDVVYNLAGIADIGEARLRPLDTVNLNILGNSTLLEAARQAQVKRFVFASTIYVYSQSGSFYRTSKQASIRFALSSIWQPSPAQPSPAQRPKPRRLKRKPATHR